MTSLFDNFDIWCINLKHRTDRREKMEQIFRTMNILDRVQFYTATLDPRGGRTGCYQSHYNCLTSSSRPYIIVFEDDCEYNQYDIESIDWNKILKDVQTYLQVYDYFSIACVPLQESFVIRDTSTFKISEGTFTSMLCYAIKRTTVEQIRPYLLNQLEIEPIDYSFWKLFYWEQLYACGYSVPLFKQSFRCSDNPWSNNQWIDGLLRVFAQFCYINQPISQKIGNCYYRICYFCSRVSRHLSFEKV